MPRSRWSRTGRGGCTATPRRRCRPAAGRRSGSHSASLTPCSSVSLACSRRGSGSPCGCAPGGRHEARQAPGHDEAGGAAAALTLALLRRRPGRLRLDRGRAALGLAARGAARYAASAPRLFAAAGEQRQLLREDLALQTAEDVAGTLGAMKGVMMKIGQMASYVDGGLSPAVRRTLARLQDSVPPMSPALAAAVVEEELGAPPERAFARWDPRPIAAASIGQVHRAVTLDGRAVAVKVQYPGVAETITADLRNAALLRRMLRIAAPAQDIGALLSELQDRIAEELDYRREAASQRLMAAYYHGHPTIHVPASSTGCPPAG